MNDKELEKLKNFSDKVLLSVDEKKDLREKMISQMRAVEIKQMRNKNSHQLWFSQFLQPKLVPYFAVVLVFVLGSGGIAAAQVSLPGSPFYGIKVNVNEKVKGIFIVSSEDKAQREIELVSRRLEETRDLALAEKLDSKTREIVQGQLEKHTEKVKVYIKNSEDGNDISQAIDLQSKLEVALATNEKILTKIEPVSSEVSPVVARVRQELSDVSEEKSILQNDLSVKSEIGISIVAKDRLEAAKKATVEVEKLLNLGTPKSDTNYTQQVFVVKQNLEKGESLLQEGMYDEALIYFDQSFRDSSEIKFLIENSEEEEKNKIFIKNKSIQLGIPQEDLEELDVNNPPSGQVEGSVKGVNTNTGAKEIDVENSDRISPSILKDQVISR